jgi:hypothetical protein
MVTVSERTSEGWHLVTVAYEDATEGHERARSRDAIEELAARLGAGSQILYRGRARIQLA